MSSMMPPDIAAMMGGGGGDPAGGGLPPDLMALMGGGGAPPEAMEGEAGPPSVVEGQPGGGEEALVTAIDSIQDAIDAESDQEDIQVMLQCQAKLQGILAKNQQDADKALGGQASPKAVRKMAPSAEGGAY